MDNMDEGGHVGAVSEETRLIQRVLEALEKVGNGPGTAELAFVVGEVFGHLAKERARISHQAGWRPLREAPTSGHPLRKRVLIAHPNNLVPQIGFWDHVENRWTVIRIGYSTGTGRQGEKADVGPTALGSSMDACMFMPLPRKPESVAGGAFDPHETS